MMFVRLVGNNYFNEGVELYNSGDYSGAKKKYEEAIYVDGGNGKVWNGLGDAYYQLRRHKSALMAYQKACELNPKDAEILNNIAVTFYRQDFYIDALKTCEQALNLFPQNSCILNNKGDVLFKLKRYEEAIKVYENALVLDIKNADIWNNKIITLSELERYEEALKTCDQALETCPQNCSILRNKGAILYKLNQHEKAFEIYKEVLNLNHFEDNNLKASDAENSKDTVLYKLCRREKVLAEALKIDSIWKNKGDNLYKLYQYEEALKIYEETLILNAENRDAWISKGKVLHNLGRFTEALEPYDKAYSLYPQDDSIFNKVMVLLCQRDFNQAYKIFSEEEFDNDIYEYIGKGFLSILEKEFINAERNFNSAIAEEKEEEKEEEYDDDAGGNFLWDPIITPYERAISKLGRDLIAYYKTNTQQFPDPKKAQNDTVYYFLQGLGLIALNDLKNAKQSFNEVLKIVPNHKPAQEQISRIDQNPKLAAVSQDDERLTIELTRMLTETVQKLEETLDINTKLNEENNQLKGKIAQLGNENFSLKIENLKKDSPASKNHNRKAKTDTKISDFATSLTQMLNPKKQVSGLGNEPQENSISRQDHVASKQQ